jgi:hypothetical protein
MVVILLLGIAAGLGAWWWFRRQGPIRVHHRRAAWAWGLLAAALPAGIVALIVIEAIADAMGMSMGVPRNEAEVAAQDWLNYAFFAAVGAPVIASIAVGLRAWRRDRDALALVAALTSAALLVAGTVMIWISWT